MDGSRLVAAIRQPVRPTPNSREGPLPLACGAEPEPASEEAQRSVLMNTFKPGAWGFVLGSIVTMIVGFSWGGWTTGSTADRLAMEKSTTAVTAALVPVCLERSKADPSGA